MASSPLLRLLSAAVHFACFLGLVRASQPPFDPVLALGYQSSVDHAGAEIHQCPLTCENRDSSQWTVYPSVDHLSQCNEPMLFDFAIHTDVEVHGDALKVRACTTTGVDKTPGDACSVSAKQRKATLSLSHEPSRQALGSNAVDDAISCVSQLPSHFGDGRCDSTIRFGYSNGTIAGLYAGATFGKSTIGSVSAALSAHLRDQSSPGTTITQLCGDSRNANHVFGIIVSSAGDLAKVQKTVVTWSQANCVASSDRLEEVEVWEDPSDYPQLSLELRGLKQRDTCKTITVQSGDSCGKLASRCKITAAQFSKYNNKDDLCEKLQPEQRVCCSPGTLPDLKPKPNSDGSCAVHHVIADDNCSKLAAKYGISTKNIETFNKGTTWGWNGCSSLMIGTNICVSTGDPPLPAPVPNAVCGPTKRGTKRPRDGKLTDLNPCPLNACCNIWGQCGTTKEFCVQENGPTGNPGTAPKGVNGCVANCGTEIVNKVAPSTFGRIGYYESWNGDRDCLTMGAADATRDGKYSSVHWAFAAIDPTDWSVVIKDKHKQWDSFSKLKDTKKVVAFGGWAFSTEAATYDVLRQAMTPEHRGVFAKNVAKFLDEKKLHGVDFDWEYPGADVSKGMSTDGPNYLAFLKALRKELGDRKTISIAAPASYFYLKSFPIKEMSRQVDYIVYMTYDLHGQWDVGSKWSQEGCPGGNCLRSHVDMPETMTALSMITKAGVDTNKIYVGESSYGRSFKMSKAGCTNSKCTFLGTNKVSMAKPGRCTKTAGYIANAEIAEIISKGKAKTYHDDRSNSDILVYGDTEWVAYMSETTKNKRRAYWKSNKFAGTVDWAVDLQTFNPTPAKVDSPTTTKPATVTSTMRPGEEDKAEFNCAFFDPPDWDSTRQLCKEPCREIVEQAQKDDPDATTNYGCVGNYPLNEPIPYRHQGGKKFSLGVCVCNNGLVNKIFDFFLDAMAAIAQISCFLLMSAFKFILNVAIDLVPGGAALKTGLQGIVNAASYIDYSYDSDNDPQGAFDFFLSPCGGTDLVPDDLKKGFDIAIGAVGGGVRGVKLDKTPKPNWRKGEGKKGDKRNPHKESPTTKNDAPSKTTTDHGPTTEACRLHKRAGASRTGRNAVVSKGCTTNTVTTTIFTITSLKYGAQKKQITATCLEKWNQACHHYSSAIKRNPAWETLTCPTAAATPSKLRGDETPALATWAAEHKGKGWKDPLYFDTPKCERDEYPPIYLLDEADPIVTDGGTLNTGQSLRYLPSKQNGGAASMWAGKCFWPFIRNWMSPDELFEAATDKQTRFDVTTHSTSSKNEESFSVGITVPFWPEFTISQWDHIVVDKTNDPYGYKTNKCWPQKIARNDPGFPILSIDPYYNNIAPPYKYNETYKYTAGAPAKDQNGSAPKKRDLDGSGYFFNGTLEDYDGGELEYDEDDLEDYDGGELEYDEESWEDYDESDLDHDARDFQDDDGSDLEDSDNDDWESDEEEVY